MATSTAISRLLKTSILISFLCVLFIQDTSACHAIALVNFTQQNPVAGGIQVTAASDSPTCGCDVYWLDVEVRCLNEAFDAAPFSPGFHGPLATYPYFQSAQMNKPNCVVQNYPMVTIPYATLCPGMTYQYRMRENHNGQVGPWCAAQTFTVPGATQPIVASANATQTVICAGDCINLSSSVVQGCALADTYQWDNGLGTNPNVNNVCPAVTTTYCVTITEACSGFADQACVTVNVVPPPVNGAASVTPTSFCSPTANPTLTLVGYAGAIQWQSAPNAGGPWTNIAGGTTSPFNAPTINGPTCFRAEISGCGPGGVSTLYSNVVCITQVVINPPAMSSTGETCQNSNDGTATAVADAQMVAPLVYSWNTVPVQNTPTATGLAAGTYTVTISDGNGCGAIDSVVVAPGIPINANFQSPAVCESFSNAFTDLSTPAGTISSWRWDFDNNGTVDNITQNPNYTFPGPGTYNVELAIVGTGGCQDSTTIQVFVHTNPVADFTATSECFGTATTLTDISTSVTGTVTGWDWDFGDGVGTSILQNPTYTFNSPGFHNVTLTVTSDSGCVHDTTIAVEVYSLPVANFTPNVACAGNNTYFMDSSAIAASPLQYWNWDFDNNATIDDINQNPIYVFPAGAGNYPVNLNIIDANGCMHDTSINVAVAAQPTAAFSVTSECFGTANIFTDLSNPNGGIISNWDWDFTDNGTVDDITQNTSYIYGDTGTYTAELHITTALGCKDSITMQVTVTPAPITNFTGTNECLGTATTFADLTTVNVGTVTGWDWDFGDGVGTSILQNPTYTYNSPGIYNVTLTTSSNNGCTHDTTIAVEVYSLPVANFTPNVACAGNNTYFMDVSTIASSPLQYWNWDFDNNATIDDINQNPIYVFPAGAGNYPVNLNIIDANGCVHDTSINVAVAAQPAAAFSVTNECFGTANTFTDLSNPNGGVISNWDWDFTDNGTVDDIAQNTSNIYAAPGTYTAELHITTALGCKDSISMQVVVNPMPIADFSVADECFGTANTFNDLSSITSGTISWNWDFGDGVGTSVLQNPTYTYANPGTYPVTLTVTSDSGCSVVYVGSAKSIANPTAAFGTNNVCLNAFASFTDMSNGNGGTINAWYWDFDGNGSTDNISQNPSNLYAVDGIYNVQLIVETGFGCLDTVVRTIEIYPMPVADYTFFNQCFGTSINFEDNSSVTSGNITNWDWSFGNSNISIIQNPSENYAGEGVYTSTLIVTTNNGCKDTLSQQVEVYPIPVVDFGPLAVCLNTATEFNDLTTVSNANTLNTIDYWQWNFGDGVGMSNIQNPTYTYATEGVYQAYLIVTTNNGCSDSLMLDVTVNPLPEVSFSAPANGCGQICINDFANTTTINAPGLISTWSWDFGDGSSINNSANPQHCYINTSYSVVNTHTVTLSVMSDQGCPGSHTEPLMVTVYPIPLADFSYTPPKTDIYDSEISFIDQSIYASSWDWNLGEGATSIIQNPVHLYLDSGSFLVTLNIENEYGCVNSTEKTVVIDPTYAIWIPNTFTPNSDGENDFFFVSGYGIEQLELIVFDRWGAIMYQGATLDAAWDGSYKGKLGVQDTYVYRVRAKDVFDVWHEYVGKVTLLK
jgi:gliding motility-associated-like protein